MTWRSNPRLREGARRTRALLRGTVRPSLSSGAGQRNANAYEAGGHSTSGLGNNPRTMRALIPCPPLGTLFFAHVSTTSGRPPRLGSTRVMPVNYVRLPPKVFLWLSFAHTNSQGGRQPHVNRSPPLPPTHASHRASPGARVTGTLDRGVQQHSLGRPTLVHRRKILHGRTQNKP